MLTCLAMRVSASYAAVHEKRTGADWVLDAGYRRAVFYRFR